VREQVVGQLEDLVSRPREKLGYDLGVSFDPEAL